MEVDQPGLSSKTEERGRPAVVVANRHLAPFIPALAASYRILLPWEGIDQADLEAVRAIIVAGEVRLEPVFLEQFPALELIACATVGYDGVDLHWARARGIKVTHGADANQEDVADHAIGLILASVRQIVEGDAAVRAGIWMAGQKRITGSLASLRLGIVGLGRIGHAIANRALVMRMNVAWWGPNMKKDAGLVRAESLLALAANSDVLVVAARSDDDTRGLISRQVIEALGPTGLLVNVARGSLVDEGALIDALRCGKLGAAALDVFREEPTPASRWQEVPNLIVTPHTGGATHNAVRRMTELLLANLAALHRNEPLITPVA